MENLATLLRDDSTSKGELFLGPGRVCEVTADHVVVRIDDDRQVRAQLALSLPYLASEGDELVVLGKEDRFYAVGVLQGTGKTALWFQGDVDMRAVGGSLRLAADKDVHVAGQRLELRATDLTMLAETLKQKLGSVYSRVRGLLSTRAEQTHTVVDDSSLTKAKNASILTEESMSINGKQIHLG